MWEQVNVFENTDKEYTIACGSFLREGGDNYTMLANNAIDPFDFGPFLDSVRTFFLIFLSFTPKRSKPCYWNSTIAVVHQDLDSLTSFFLSFLSFGC